MNKSYCEECKYLFIVNKIKMQSVRVLIEFNRFFVNRYNQKKDGDCVMIKPADCAFKA
jgi:hypothetical protein